MASLNRAMIIGCVNIAPVIKYTSAGEPVTTFPIITTEKHKSKTGEMEDRPELHYVRLHGKLAEIAAEFLDVGKSVYVEGLMKNRAWIDSAGNHSRTEILADKLQMLGGGRA